MWSHPWYGFLTYLCQFCATWHLKCSLEEAYIRVARYAPRFNVTTSPIYINQRFRWYSRRMSKYINFVCIKMIWNGYSRSIICNQNDWVWCFWLNFHNCHKLGLMDHLEWNGASEKGMDHMRKELIIWEGNGSSEKGTGHPRKERST